MKVCPICKSPIEDWQALCENCWKSAEEAYKIKRIENGELVERLKAKAKENLLDLMREVCKRCPKFRAEVSDPVCKSCALKEKENLIRAFLE